MIAPLLLVLFFSGCVQAQMLPHLDEALTLRSFSAQKDEQHQYVRDADARFDQLLAAVRSGGLQKYKTYGDIVHVFGPPVLIEDIVIDGLPSTYCLYRHAIASKAKQKVYLYFDNKGLLVKWEQI